MESELGIGEFASLVGLTVSALRFYDDAAVLKPVRVDQQSGYRYYSASQVVTGRLLRQLRAAGMPLALVREVLSTPPSRARRLIDEYRQQVEQRLEDARGSASEAIRLLDSMEDAMKITCTVDGAELRRALTQLLHATPGPEVTRVPDGVLLAIHPDALRLVATDGHRLAVRDLVAEGSGQASVVLAAPPIRANLATLPLGTQKVELIDGHCLIGGVEHSVLQVDFPAYARILPGHRPALSASFELGALRSSLQEGEELTILRFEPGSVV
ncbi:MAG: MerR family transcriptional regulator, partial [Candidatus Dormibacteraeota bacterium]|nr:MerR family transcriptional regulator [Candidatus Dormibacteraeota bacterium]